jgi:multiple sugar transport system permease protein
MKFNYHTINRVFHTAGRLFLYFFIITGAFIAFFPFLWSISTSLKTNRMALMFPPKLIPSPPMWRNYVKIFVDQPLLSAFFNSSKIAVINTAGTLLSSAMAGYGFAKLRFRFKNQLFLCLLATMMIPGQVTLIPMYVWFHGFGWIDTHLPLIVPAVLSNAYGVFLLRQFFMTIPNSYVESAMIDGAPQPIIFFRIMLPLCIPALATLGLFSFMSSWNSFLTPLIYLNTLTKYTLPVIIRTFNSMYTIEWGLLMAASCFSIMPTIILFLSAQRYFFKGTVMSGLKG